MAFSFRLTFFRLNRPSISQIRTGQRVLPHLLTRHNESPANIAVLDETLSVGQVEFLSEVQGCNARCIRNLQISQDKHFGTVKNY